MRKLKIVLSTCILIAACPAFADNAAPSTANTPAAAPAAPSPYQLKLQYTGEEWGVAAGGLQTGSIYMNNFDAKLQIDTDKAFGWTGGKAVMEGYYASSRTVTNDFVGATDGLSPIDSYGATRIALYQAYYDQDFGSTQAQLGFWDPQQTFGQTSQQEVFLNRNFAWNTALDDSGGTLNYAGDYPWTTLAVHANHDFNSDWSVQGAVLNGMADTNKDEGLTTLQMKGRFGVIGLSEVDYTPDRYSKAYVGYWRYTGQQKVYNRYNADGDNLHTYGNDGGYVGGGTRLYAQDAHRGLDGFINLGFADPAANYITRSFNGGVTYTGLFDARPHDVIGLATTFNAASSPYMKEEESLGTQASVYETNTELTYHAKINDWLKVQPDVQYITHPGFNGSLHNAIAAGVHFEIGHWFGL